MYPQKFFIGGLGPYTTTESLHVYFAQFGEVVDAIVMERDGQPRGFGFVTFADPNIGPYLLQQQHFIDGKEVEVKLAVPQEQISGTPQPAVANKPKKIFIGGLSQSTTKEALAEYFGRFGILEDYVVMTDQAGTSRCFGFVTFSTPEEAESVFEYPTHVIDGKTVECKRAEPRGSTNLPPARPQSQPSAVMPPYPPYATYQLPQQPVHPQYQQQMHQQAYPMAPVRQPTSYDYYQAAYQQTHHGPRMGPGATENPHSYGAKLFVGGLSQLTTEESMAGYFSHFGYVVAVEVMRREDRSRGFGFVVFQSDQEAYLALQHLPHIIDGKTVECKACSPKTAEPPPKRTHVAGSTPASYDAMRQRFRPY